MIANMTIMVSIKVLKKTLIVNIFQKETELIEASLEFFEFQFTILIDIEILENAFKVSNIQATLLLGDV